MISDNSNIIPFSFPNSVGEISKNVTQNSFVEILDDSQVSNQSNMV